MKNKIKFNTQNFKHKFKIFVITFIILASVYLLYFNDKIFVQSIIQNSLHNEDIPTKSNNIENFDVDKYVDICKNKKTRFYDFTSETTPLSVYSIDGSNNCENLCDTTPNCQFFLMNENNEQQSRRNNRKTCYLYTRPLDSSNIDTNTMNIKVNCNSTIIPVSNNYYNGYGYVNKNYFQYNKNKFSYIDAYLDKANELIKTIKDRRANLDAIANPNQDHSQHSQLTSNARYYNISIGDWITSFGELLGINSNNLTTVNNTTNLFTDNILDDEKNNVFKKLAAISKETPELDNKLIDVKNSGYVNNLFYTILAFIMVITIILLILYKLNNNIIITDKFMILYFIIIVILFMFIQFMLNK